MIERVIENWLDNAIERSYEIPFCYTLIDEGYKVLHMTRHSSMEMGKDIIAVNQNGIPYAYQLKNVTGRRLTISQYRRDLQNQLIPLAYTAIDPPALYTRQPHIPVVVINGDLDEDVQREINNFNVVLEREGKNKVEVINRGALLDKFLKLRENLWPNNLTNIKNYLEIYISNGSDLLNKEKFCKLIYSSLPFEQSRLTIANLKRSLSSTALICSSAILNYSNQKNYFAEFEAWIIYWSHALSLCEKYSINLRHISGELNLIKISIFNTLSNLCNDLIENPDGVDRYSHSLEEVFIYRMRLTLLLGLMSIYGLWRRLDGTSTDMEIILKETSHHDEFVKEFCLTNSNKLRLWGEYNVPQLFAFYLFYRKLDATPRPDFLVLYRLIRSILKFNKIRSKKDNLPNPYYDYSVLPKLFGFEDEKIKEDFSGSSYTLEGIFHIFVRLNWKQHTKPFWDDYSKMVLKYFKYNKKWHFYLWRCKEGTEVSKLIKPTYLWSDLKNEAFESNGDEIPDLIKKFPILYLCLLIVMPHRMNSSGVRWIHSELLRI